MMDRRLAPPQIDADPRLEPGIDRLAQIVPQQHVFGGDRRVGLELVDPVAIMLLLGEQALRTAYDCRFDPRTLGGIGGRNCGIEGIAGQHRGAP